MEIGINSEYTNIASISDEFSNFKSQRRPQIISALSASIGSFALGTTIGWSSSALESISQSEGFQNLSDIQLSWIASIATLGAFVGALLAGFLISKVGRKETLVVNAIPFVFGWIILTLASNLFLLLLGRFLTGFGAGAISLTVPVYISEIAENKIRGVLSNMSILFLVSGILFSYLVGYLNHVKLSMICSFIPFIFFICMTLMPESPRYLLSKDRLRDAADSLIKLRGANDYSNIQAEINSIQSSLNEEVTRSASLFQPSIMKPLLISLALMFFQQLCGINAIMFYGQDIFASSGTNIDSHLSSIIIATMQCIFVAISTCLVDIYGRRILLLISEFGMAVSLLSLGTFFYLKDVEKHAEGLDWLPLVSLIVYIATYNLGIGPLPWVMMGEILPSIVKGKASSIAASVNWILAFFVTVTFKLFVNLIGNCGCFWLFAVVCVVGFIFVLFYVPETKGKSLEEIQEIFQQGERQRIL